MTERIWRPGEAVVMRHSRGHYRWAAAMRVVHDLGNHVALYQQPGSDVAKMAGDDGQLTRDFYDATGVVRSTWGLNRKLELIAAGDWHSVNLFWDEKTWEFRCWYINLQEPFRRSAQGFESMDLTLDLVVAPDLSRSMCKDEDEFRHGIAAGFYTEQEYRDLRSEGERVLEAIARRAPPFNEPWPDWRPDPAWTPAALPEDWDR